MSEPTEDLTQYRVWGLTLLQLMGVLFIVGIVLDIAVRLI